MARSRIRIKKQNRGKLRKAAGVKKGEKIPAGKLQTLAHSQNPDTRRRAVFALNARKWRKGGKSRG